MSYLLDSNVISELRRRRPDPNVVSWVGSVPEDELLLSVLVIGEIRQGIDRLRRRDPRQAGGHELWLDAVKREYAERLVPVTAEVAEEWGRLHSRRPLPFADGLMAATALVYDWTFVTRNTKHIEATGVRLVNPFEP